MDLKDLFGKISTYLSENEQAIMDTFNSIQGNAINMGGHYKPADKKGSAAMRPSDIFNKALDLIE